MLKVKKVEEVIVEITFVKLYAWSESKFIGMNALHWLLWCFREWIEYGRAFVVDMFTDTWLCGGIFALLLVLVRLWFEVVVYLCIVMDDYEGASVGIKVSMLKCKKVEEVILTIAFVMLC